MSVNAACMNACATGGGPEGPLQPESLPHREKATQVRMRLREKANPDLGVRQPTKRRSHQDTVHRQECLCYWKKKQRRQECVIRRVDTIAVMPKQQVSVRPYVSPWITEEVQLFRKTA